MSLFISSAWAVDTPSFATGGNFANIFLLVAFIGVFYFLIWRPQSKRAKTHRELMQGLAKGDEIVSSGGMMGLVTKVDDNYVRVKIGQNIEISLQKHAVTATLPKGTLKALENG